MPEETLSKIHRVDTIFMPLAGHHLPLGTFADSRYQMDGCSIVEGQILLVGTDGIWEAINARGEMFGKERFKAVVRRHCQATAEEIAGAVMAALQAFCAGEPPSDDITLVVAKVIAFPD